MNYTIKTWWKTILLKIFIYLKIIWYYTIPGTPSVNTLIYVRPLNEWQILELGHFDVGNFGQKLALFLAIMISFSQLLVNKGARATFNGLNESWDLQLFLFKKNPDMWYSLPPVTHQMSKIEKSENFCFFKSVLWSPKDLPNHFFLYDPVGPKIWIASTSIWSQEHSWTENKWVGRSFEHKWDLKNKNFPIFRFSTFDES